MILTHHKISIIKEDANTINVFNFISQLFKLRKYTIVYFENYNQQDDNQVVICFDDAHISLVKIAIPLLKLFKYKYEVFVCEKFLYDESKNFIKFKHLNKIIQSNGRLEYHTKSHRNLTEIQNEEELENQICCPEFLKKQDPYGFKFIAYPYWQFNDNVIQVVKKYYNGARSGNGFSNSTIYALDSIKIGKNIKFIGAKN